MRFLSAMILSVFASGCIGFCGGGPDTATTEASLYVTGDQGQPAHKSARKANLIDA